MCHDCSCFFNLNRIKCAVFRHFEDFEKRIPRDEVSRFEVILKGHVTEEDEDYLATVCGSYRRGAASSGDMDVLLTHPSYTSKDKKKVCTKTKPKNDN